MNEKQKVIFEIQDYLRNISFYDSRVPFIVSDGMFGSETTEAVKIFQSAYGLSDDGKVGFATWTRLTEVNKLATETPAQPFRPAPIEQSDLPLKQGDSNNFVYHLNLMLSRLSKDFTNFTEPTDYSIFNDDTQRQIKRWQRVVSIPQTGVVDKITWNLLSSYYLI